MHSGPRHLTSDTAVSAASQHCMMLCLTWSFGLPSPPPQRGRRHRRDNSMGFTSSCRILCCRGVTGGDEDGLRDGRGRGVAAEAAP